jgi:hypothetical protein
MDARRAWLLEEIEERSRLAAQALAGQLAHSPAEEKEAILAEIEFEQWLADACEDCRNGR